jgi:hypothetical protein
VIDLWDPSEVGLEALNIRPALRRRLVTSWLLTAAALAVCAGPDVAAQEIRGRIVDAQNGAPVGLALIIVLDADRSPLLQRAADVQGLYSVVLPGAGEYYLVFERLGYFENESPLLAVDADGTYGVDIEMRPEPFRLDPLEVTVENERLEDFLTLEFGQHPASLPGYRVIQGMRLQEAKAKARDNTDLLRWLYIPVSHGSSVCVNVLGAPLPPRSTMEQINQRAEERNPGAQCGAIYVDGRRCRNEHLESIAMDRIGVVVALRGAVHLYTRQFDWTFRPGGGAPGC